MCVRLWGARACDVPPAIDMSTASKILISQPKIAISAKTNDMMQYNAMQQCAVSHQFLVNIIITAAAISKLTSMLLNELFVKYAVSAIIPYSLQTCMPSDIPDMSSADLRAHLST